MRTFSDFIQEQRIKFEDIELQSSDDSDQFINNMLTELDSFDEEFEITKPSNKSRRLTTEDIEKEIKAIEEEFGLDDEDSDLLLEQDEETDEETEEEKKRVVHPNIWSTIPKPVNIDNLQEKQKILVKRNKITQGKIDGKNILNSKSRNPQDGTYSNDFFVVIPLSDEITQNENAHNEELVGLHSLAEAILAQLNLKALPRDPKQATIVGQLNEPLLPSSQYKGSYGFTEAVNKIRTHNKIVLKLNENGEYQNKWWNVLSSKKLLGVSSIKDNKDETGENVKFIIIDVINNMDMLHNMYGWTFNIERFKDVSTERLNNPKNK
jgi:hypothetical protein